MALSENTLGHLKPIVPFCGSLCKALTWLRLPELCAGSLPCSPTWELKAMWIEGLGGGEKAERPSDTGEQHQKQNAFLWDRLIKPDCSSLSYKRVTKRTDPTVILICHNFKTNTVVLFSHRNLFWLPALSICSYHTNIHSRGVHNSPSRWTWCHLQPWATSCPCCGCAERGPSVRKSTGMFLTSKYQQSHIPALSNIGPLQGKSQREQVPRRKWDLCEQFHYLILQSIGTRLAWHARHHQVFLLWEDLAKKWNKIALRLFHFSLSRKTVRYPEKADVRPEFRPFMPCVLSLFAHTCSSRAILYCAAVFSPHWPASLRLLLLENVRSLSNQMQHGENSNTFHMLSTRQLSCLDCTDKPMSSLHRGLLRPLTWEGA